MALSNALKSSKYTHRWELPYRSITVPDDMARYWDTGSVACLGQLLGSSPLSQVSCMIHALLWFVGPNGDIDCGSIFGNAIWLTTCHKGLLRKGTLPQLLASASLEHCKVEHCKAISASLDATTRHPCSSGLSHQRALQRLACDVILQGVQTQLAICRSAAYRASCH